MQIRKQVYDLTPTDFDHVRLWEFALDEEGAEGQDEATVRPVESALPSDLTGGEFIVKARFSLADGSDMSGYLTPVPAGELDLGRIQPAIVTENGQVSFWCGKVEPSEEYLNASYKILGKRPADVFPLRFASDFPLPSGPIEGSVAGFLVLLDFESDAVKVVH